MTKEEYQDFVLRYKGCGACFPLYEKLTRFEKMWFTAIQKDVVELEKENAELKEKLTAIRNAKDKYDMSKDKSIIKAFGAEYTLFCGLERILEDWQELEQQY